MAFLMDHPHTAKLATVRADGRPHIAPVWFTLDGDTIIFTTWHTTVKANNIRRDPRVCLYMDDETPPFIYVIIEGTASISGDIDALWYWAQRIAGRYIGSDLADAYGQRNGVEGEYLIHVTPTKVIGET